MESERGRAFQTEGIDCTTARRQESRFEARVAGVEKARGELRRGGQVRTVIIQGLVGHKEEFGCHLK